MNILLVYLPFCTPASPPYSLTYLASFLKANSKHNIDVLDLNLEFHKKKFPEHHKYYQEGKFDDYEEKTTEFNKITSKLYLKNNRAVVNGEKPELFEEMLKKIRDRKPDLILFSLVYSSQAFYAYALLKELKNVVIGGPAVNDKLRKLAKCLNNEVELLNYIGEDGKQDASVKHDELDCNIVPDFSIYNLKDYFCPKPVIPIKTSSTCYYKGCTFCTHFTSQPYCEYDLELIKRISDSVSIPVVAFGGVGNWQHLVDGINIGHADAVSAANIFHFTEHSTYNAKEFMINSGLNVRKSKFYQLPIPRRPKYNEIF